MLTQCLSSDELNQVDDQIAAYAQEHIHSNEVSDDNISFLGLVGIGLVDPGPGLQFIKRNE